MTLALSWPIVAAVLFGAFLHASWNALIKSGDDPALDTALMHVLGCGVGVVLVAAVGLPDRAALPFLATSVVIHVGYYVTLVGAYKHGELGFAYPVMRGTAPLIVALLSGQLIGEHVPVAAWLGVAGISAGVLAIGLTRSARATGSHPHADGHPDTRSTALAYALANAAIIASYTIVDGIGVRKSGNALQYVALLFLVDGLPYFAIVLWLRRRAVAPVFAYMRARWPVALLGSCASLGAYGIALWAMTRAPVASVAALRETSVLFAALIGVFMLKERFRLQRAFGTGAIIAGVMALRLA
jgi:phosphonate utilization associated putative membrane protein